MRDDGADVRHLHRAAGRLAGEDILRAFGMRVADAGRRLRHAAHDRQLVGDLSGLAQQLGEIDAGDIGLDGLEGTAMFGGGVRLGIPGVHLRHAALLEDDQHLLRLAGSGGAFGGGVQVDAGQRGQHPAQSDADEVATR